MNMTRIVLMHPMDPRGAKLGGIETHVRLILSAHPADVSILFVGVDEIGDRTLGVCAPIDYEGRRVDFLPVAAIGGDRINLAGRSLLQSTTFRFAVGALRYLPAIKRAIGKGPASADLQRFEFAILAKLLGLPTVQMVHGEGSPDQKMDSLIRKLWFVHRFNETVALKLASRILCVNPNIITRLQKILPRVTAKAEVMTVSVDTRRFSPQPFDLADGVFKIVFAGRLDSFKDPPLMFRILRGLHARLEGRLEFHYIGTTDPARYAEFTEIEGFTFRHGFQTAAGVAALVGQAHAGILTSFFEGMPCYLLETLSRGRPFCAIRLPQYDSLVVAGVSGSLVERSEPDDACCAAMVEAFVALWADIRAGCIDPLRVHDRVEPYSVETQMGRLFAHHRALQAPALPAP